MPVRMSIARKSSAVGIAWKVAAAGSMSKRAGLASSRRLALEPTGNERRRLAPSRLVQHEMTVTASHIDRRAITLGDALCDARRYESIVVARHHEHRASLVTDPRRIHRYAAEAHVASRSAAIGDESRERRLQLLVRHAIEHELSHIRQSWNNPARSEDGRQVGELSSQHSSAHDADAARRRGRQQYERARQSFLAEFLRDQPAHRVTDDDRPLELLDEPVRHLPRVVDVA